MDDVNLKIKRVRMTLKDRIEPDRIPIHDFFWDEFLDRWKEEMGLPKDTSIYEYYDMDMVVLYSNYYPMLKPIKIIESTDKYFIYEDGFGSTVKQLKNISSVQYIDFKYKNLEDLEKFKFINPSGPRRCENPINTISNGKIIELPSFKETVKGLALIKS